MSELGSIRVIILVYTGQTDLKQIVSHNNKMTLFYFHGSVKHSIAESLSSDGFGRFVT